MDINQLRNVTMDDEELMREILTALLEDTTQQLVSLEQAVREGDSNRAMRLAHSSKGACANVGAAAAAAVFQKIERTAAAGNTAACEPSLTALAVELEKLKHEVAVV